MPRHHRAFPGGSGATRDFGERNIKPPDSHLYEWSRRQIVDPSVPWGATFDRKIKERVARIKRAVDAYFGGKEAE